MSAGSSVRGSSRPLPGTGAQAKEQEPRVEEEQHEEQGEGRGAVQDFLGGRKGTGEG